MYKTKISLLETQKAINLTEEIFKKELSKQLNIEKVTGPLFVPIETGVNDTLSGTEKPVSFEYNKQVLEIVHSLAKWKRMALKEYKIKKDRGIFVEMTAIRPNENYLSSYHSLHVDQYDWEKIITKEDRTLTFLITQVESIYKALKETKEKIKNKYSSLVFSLPEKITFISSHKLLKMFPKLSSEEREKEITRIHKAVFIYEIGHKMEDKKIHGLRAPDYDDWMLNGDLIMWDYQNQKALELSSMGIRVDKESLKKQMDHCKQEYKEFHKMIQEDSLPLSIGGGIGKSRINMFILEKAHIGEVQSTFWPKEYREQMTLKGIELLK